MPLIELIPAHDSDFEELAALRLEAMRPSLERIGRFDAQRSLERFRAAFDAGCTRHIVVEQQRAGFVALHVHPQHIQLEHLYLRAEFQNRGVGSEVLALVLQEADQKRLAVRVGALRSSDSNRFYLRHGFVWLAETQWDVFYERPVRELNGA